MADPTSSVTSPPKRPRPVLSCLECRRKKLKCDRLLPCQQCLKGGRSHLCHYAEGQDPELRSAVSAAGDQNAKKPRIQLSNFTPASNGDTHGFDDLQDRVRKLEQALRLQESQGNPEQPLNDVVMSMSPAPPSIGQSSQDDYTLDPSEVRQRDTFSYVNVVFTPH